MGNRLPWSVSPSYLAESGLYWREVLTSLLDLVFPPHCVGCHQRGTHFCATCQSQAEFISPPFCPRCGRPAVNDAQTCPTCTRFPLTADGLRAAVVFGGPVRLAIHALKYNARLPLARPLAQLLATSLHNQPWQIDALVPVPLHANRQRTRGFNQSLLLARELARQTGLPMWTQALARVRDTPTQTLLGAEQRRENVHAAFRGTEARIKTRSILIVDDVLTTGATLDACAQALVAAGARHVWGLAVARPL